MDPKKYLNKPADWRRPASDLSRRQVRRIGTSFLVVILIAGLLRPSYAEEAERLHLLREFSAPTQLYSFGMLKSGFYHLAWSQDGEMLAGYIDNGLKVLLWDVEGSASTVIPRYNHFGLNAYVLSFLAGHRFLITGPAATSSSFDDTDKAEQFAFSVIDAKTGAVVRSPPGPHPEQAQARLNSAKHLAVSSDQRLAAAVFNKDAEERTIVYATNDWRQVASLDVGESIVGPTALDFSPSGDRLVVASGRKGRLNIFSTTSWQLIKTIDAFPEIGSLGHYFHVSSVRFSPDGRLLAVGSSSGGTWINPKARPFDAPQTGPIVQFPADPLRLFDSVDGSQVASLGSFPGGFVTNREFTWLAPGNGIIFIDGTGDIRLWSGKSADSSRIVGSVHQADSILTSPDRRKIAVSYPEGIRIFELNQP